MRKHKKYRIRTGSPAWYVKLAAETMAAWALLIGAAAAAVGGIYACILLMASMPV